MPNFNPAPEWRYERRPVIISKRKAYLAGPVSNLFWNEAKSWRADVKTKLEADGRFEALDPLRGKEQLALVGKMAASGYTGKASDQAIFQLCKYDVSRCDLIFCNLLGAKDKSLGTAFELGWGHLWGKYIVTVMEDGNPHDHAFVKVCSSIILSTVDEAVDYVLKVF